MTTIPFRDISTGGSHYVVENITGFTADDGLALAGPTMARCTLRKKQDHLVECSGTLQTTVALECDRCLNPFTVEISTEFGFLLQAGDVEDWHVRDLEISETDLETVALDQTMVDLNDLLRQQILLSLPMRRVCSQDCQGLCPGCGADRAREKCSCTDNVGVSPFAVLANLKNKK